jgi:hypothetical protein
MGVKKDGKLVITKVIPNWNTTKDGVKNSQATQKRIWPREIGKIQLSDWDGREEILKGIYKISIKVRYRGDKGKDDNNEKHTQGWS